MWLSQKVGLDSITIGSVFAINGVFAVVLKPVYGYIMDKIGMSKWLLYFVCAISALMAPFLRWCTSRCWKAMRWPGLSSARCI